MIRPLPNHSLTSTQPLPNHCSTTAQPLPLACAPFCIPGPHHVPSPRALTPIEQGALTNGYAILDYSLKVPKPEAFQTRKRSLGAD